MFFMEHYSISHLTTVLLSFHNSSISVGTVPISDGWSVVEHCLLVDGLFVCWLFNVPATCECVSGADLLRQFYVLPH